MTLPPLPSFSQLLSKLPQLPPDLLVVILTIVTSAAIFSFYYFVLKPTIVVPASIAGQCPDAWSYDETKNLCKPGYQTTCKAYDPNTNPMTITQMCEFAKTCSTTWTGIC